MSLIRQIPEGLKRQEVERGNGRVDAPIPYIPKKLEEVNPDRKVPTIKIDLSNGIESGSPVWEGIGTKEHFLCHMRSIQEALEAMGLVGNQEEARKQVSEAKEQMQHEKDLRDVVLEQIENTVLKADKVPLREEVAKYNEAIKGFKGAVVAAAKQEQVAAMTSFFSTTANFFQGHL
jgi:hypothetical protein